LGKSFTERFGSGGAQNCGSRAAATVGRERERKERAKKEERLWLNRYRDKGASLVDALLRYKGASLAGALPADVARSSV
jgi:hypothetical protein